MITNNNTQVLRNVNTFHISNQFGLTGSQEPVRMFNNNERRYKME